MSDNEVTIEQIAELLKPIEQHLAIIETSVKSIQSHMKKVLKFFDTI